MTTTVFLESVPDSWEAELRTSIFDMAGCFWVLRAVGIGCSAALSWSAAD